MGGADVIGRRPKVDDDPKGNIVTEADENPSEISPGCKLVSAYRLGEFRTKGFDGEVAKGEVGTWLFVMERSVLAFYVRMCLFQR